MPRLVSCNNFFDTQKEPPEGTKGVLDGDFLYDGLNMSLVHGGGALWAMNTNVEAPPILALFEEKDRFRRLLKDADMDVVNTKKERDEFEKLLVEAQVKENFLQHQLSAPAPFMAAEAFVELFEKVMKAVGR